MPVRYFGRPGALANPTNPLKGTLLIRSRQCLATRPSTSPPARIMRNWTQKELADKLAVAEQQVQRYEAAQYKGVSVERLQAVADALKLCVREVTTFEPL